MLLIPSRKRTTKHFPIGVIPDPEDFFLPLDSGRSTMTPLVRSGERVAKYQLLAASDGPFASRIHAPASGTAGEIVTLDGKRMLHLENDFENREMPLSPVKDRVVTNADALADILLENGIEGAGGARFPTHLKFRIGERKIDAIIFNGVECEPYLSADYDLIQSCAAELVKAAELIRTALGAERVVFAVEKQNAELGKLLLASAAAVEVKTVPDSYPQGGELQLIRAVTGKTLRKGSIPADHGVLVSNVGTLRAIHQAIFENKPCIERVITVSGNRCPNPGNHLVKIGTPVAHVLRETGNPWNPADHLIVLGGAMMGKAIESGSTPIHKGSGGLLLLGKAQSNAQNCIKCGVCVDVCPQHLMPLEFVRHHLAGDAGALADFHLQDCIECGACAYSCLSEVPLMESIFAGKTMLAGQTMPRAK